jgi:2-dehydro-3-deoxygalactonokinase
LPGSHSKWAVLEGNELVHFDTFMTGEAFSALGNHTILARTSSVSVSAGKAPDANASSTSTHEAIAAGNDAAFHRGVVTALAPASKGVLATIFSCRTLGLSGELSPEQQTEYLSGLLIGAEIAGMRDVLTGSIAGNRDEAVDTQNAQPTVALIGDPKLCQRYIVALRLAGVGTVIPTPVIEHASQQGLWQLAKLAGLITA